jgi:hypothetical protein
VGSRKYSGSGFSLATGSETFKRKIGTQDKNTVSLNLSTNLTFSRLLSKLALKIVVMTREQGTGNREQGTLLFVTYAGFFPFTYFDAVCGVFANKIKLRSHVSSSVINYLSGSK